jgi:hypothetical protein
MISKFEFSISNFENRRLEFIVKFATLILKAANSNVETTNPKSNIRYPKYSRSFALIQLIT